VPPRRPKQHWDKRCSEGSEDGNDPLDHGHDHSQSCAFVSPPTLTCTREEAPPLSEGSDASNYGAATR
jgi:hypothetical protein